jgi:hypothetical protein
MAGAAGSTSSLQGRQVRAIASVAAGVISQAHAYGCSLQSSNGANNAGSGQSQAISSTWGAPSASKPQASITAVSMVAAPAASAM